MGLLNGSIPNLLGGISQQPGPTRLLNQLEDSKNGVFSIERGWTRRPPSNHVKIDGAFPTGYGIFVHWINRDQSERYCVSVLGNGTVRVYGLDGTSYICQTSANAATYLTTGLGIPVNMCALTVADTTILVNRKKTVALTASTNAQRNTEALVWVRQTAYNASYTVTVSGTPYTYTTGDTTAPATQGTSKIANQLKALYDAAPQTGITCTLAGSVLWFKRADTTAMSISVSDGLGGQGLTLVTGTTDSFSNLPDVAPSGYLVNIGKDIQNNVDGYYVQFNTVNGQSFASGTWAETLKYGVKYALDTTTMPMVLLRVQDDALGTVTGTAFGIYFKCQEGAWGSRKIGDTVTDSGPGFIGSTISGVFLYKGRLGLLSGMNVSMSRTNDYYNFWRKTALTMLDDDPIVIDIPHPRVVCMYHATQFNSELILWGNGAQFSITSSNVLSPKTVGTQLVSELNCSPDCTPVGVDSVIYYAYNNNGFTQVGEYYIDVNTNTKQTRPVTAHVPQLVAGSPLRMTVNSTERTLVVIPGNSASFYTYQWLFNGPDKVVSAWGIQPYLPGGDGATQFVMAATWVDHSLYLFCMRTEGMCIERIDFNLNPASYIYLDRFISTGITRSYNAGTNVTTFTLPFSNCTAVPVTSPLTPVNNFFGNTIAVPGNKLLTDYYFGQQYVSELKLSPIYLHSQGPTGGALSILDGRLQLRTVTVAFYDTAFFKVDCTPIGRPTNTWSFYGPTLQANAPSLSNVHSGKISFTVMGTGDQSVIRLYNDTIFPSNYVSIEWEGTFTARAKRL